MTRAPEGEPGKAGAGLAERKPDRVRLVRLDAVHPDGRHAVGEERGGQLQRPAKDLPRRLGVARRAEDVAPRDERDGHECRAQGAVVESVQHVQDGQSREQPDGELECAPLPPREPAGNHDQRQPERCDERARERVHALRGQRGQKRVRPLGEDRIEHAEPARDGDRASQKQGRARLHRPALVAGQRAGQPHERRREVDRAQPGRRPKRLVRRHLLHDQDGHAGLQIAPEAGPERKQQGRGQPLGPDRTGDQPERQAGRRPDGGEEEQRDPGAARKRVQRERLSNLRPRQTHRSQQVEPSGRRGCDREPREDPEKEPTGPGDPTHARGGSRRRAARARHDRARAPSCGPREPSRSDAARRTA